MQVLVEFQFYIVQLRHSDDSLLSVVDSTFQFYIVQLRRLLICYENVLTVISILHSSIKTDCSAASLGSSPLFQFYIVQLRLLRNAHSASVSQQFQFYIVQLRPLFGSHCFHMLNDFNST